MPSIRRAYVRLRHDEKEKAGAEVTYKGRAGWCYDQLGSSDKWLVLDTNQGRFHPASIAGLVVGAMGVFIFGLYL